ncbi:MAG: hypothetical protein GX061_04230 [Eubacteriaceae bacterium]|nr:hypothetical protein [Eubacteriaceae bacterium]
MSIEQRTARLVSLFVVHAETPLGNRYANVYQAKETSELFRIMSISALVFFKRERASVGIQAL